MTKLLKSTQWAPPPRCAQPSDWLWRANQSFLVLPGFSPQGPLSRFVWSQPFHTCSQPWCACNIKELLVLPISSVCWRPTVGHLERFCDAVCNLSLLRTSSPATSSFWRTHFWNISSKTFEDSLPHHLEQVLPSSLLSKFPSYTAVLTLCLNKC